MSGNLMKEALRIRNELDAAKELARRKASFIECFVASHVANYYQDGTYNNLYVAVHEARKYGEEAWEEWNKQVDTPSPDMA